METIDVTITVPFPKSMIEKYGKETLKRKLDYMISKVILHEEALNAIPEKE